MSEIDKLAWLCIKDKSLLVARSKNKNRYYIPGGKREEGENDQAALIREIKEELSIDILPQSIKYVGVFRAQADDKPENIIVKITCYSSNYSGTIEANAEIEEICWLHYHDKGKCSVVTQQIMDWLKVEDLID